MKGLIIALALFVPVLTSAQEPEFIQPTFDETVFQAVVVSVGEEGERTIEGTALSEEYQELTVRITKGSRAGEEFIIENDSSVAYDPGDKLYLHRVPDSAESPELWSVGEPDRTPVLLALLLAFIGVTLLVSGSAGIRSLIALLISFLVIIFGMVPLLLAGWPPVITSVALGIAILAISMFVTHGINRPTWIALIGSVVALVFAALLAQLSVSLAKLSGFVSDEAVFLNFATGGTLDLSGLLLGGILVGIIGVLNDVSVSQVHTVAEIHDANPALTQKAVWSRAMKVGKEHMGAVVNTLPLAYAGVSLPLLLLFSQTDAPFSFIVNRELFAAEVIRALSGSIGLLLSGAIATVLAVAFLVPKANRATITKQ